MFPRISHPVLLLLLFAGSGAFQSSMAQQKPADQKKSQENKSSTQKPTAKRQPSKQPSPPAKDVKTSSVPNATGSGLATPDGANSGISALIAVSQDKVKNANDQALAGANQEQQLVKKEQQVTGQNVKPTKVVTPPADAVQPDPTKPPKLKKPPPPPHVP